MVAKNPSLKYPQGDDAINVCTKMLYLADIVDIIKNYSNTQWLFMNKVINIC